MFFIFMILPITTTTSKVKQMLDSSFIIIKILVYDWYVLKSSVYKRLNKYWKQQLLLFLIFVDCINIYYV